MRRAKLDEMLKIEECRRAIDEIPIRNSIAYRGLLLKKLAAALLIILVSSAGLITQGLEFKIDRSSNNNETNATTSAFKFLNININSTLY